MSQGFCTICDGAVEVREYDVYHSQTSYSQSQLVLVLQQIVQEELPLPSINHNSLICRDCFYLLNEYDSIILRATAIQQEFRRFVSRIKQAEQYFSCDSSTRLSVGYKVEEPPPPEPANESCLKIEVASVQEQPRIEEQQLKVERQKEQAESIVCPICNKVFSKEADLSKHSKIHNVEKPYKCEICGQAYKLQKALKIHVGMHNGINLYTCTECNKSFTQKVALTRHMPLHTGQLPLQCEVCGKRFIHRSSFNIHKLTHEGKKLFKCDICGLELMSTSHLSRHKRVHSGEKKFVCAVCGRSFRERYNLVSHEKGHARDGVPKNTVVGTENLNPEDSNKQIDGNEKLDSGAPKKQRHRCDICYKSYGRNAQLERHMMFTHKIYPAPSNLDANIQPMKRSAYSSTLDKD